MEEEKTTKRKQKPIDVSEKEGMDFSLPTSSKPEIKKAYTVVLVTPAMVVYRAGKDSNGITQNIWGMTLQIGDEIYL
jgi:hypothetical protein